MNNLVWQFDVCHRYSANRIAFLIATITRIILFSTLRNFIMYQDYQKVNS